MKKSLLILLAAAMPVFAQGPAPVEAPVAVDGKAAFVAKYDADKDGKISAAEAQAAKKDFLRSHANQFAKKPGKRHGHGMNKFQGRRPMGPNMGKKGFGPKAPKFNMPKQGRTDAPKCGQFAPKAPKLDLKKQGRRPMGPQMRNFGPKAPKFNMNKKGFAPKCGKFQGRRPMGPQMGNFGPKAPKFNMNKKGFAPKCGKFQGRRPMGPNMGNFGPKAPKFNMNKKGFAPKCGKFQGRRPMGPNMGGCKCGKKHAPAFKPAA